MDFCEMRASFDAILINPPKSEVPRLILGTSWQGHKPDPMSELILRLQNLRDDYTYFNRGVYRMSEADFWQPHQPIGRLVEELLLVRDGQKLSVNEANLVRLKEAGFRFIYEPAHDRWVTQAGDALFYRKVAGVVVSPTLNQRLPEAAVA